MRDLAYRGRARLADEQTGASLRRLADDWIGVALGDATPANVVDTFGRATLGSYATGGVAIPGTTGALDVAMQPWTDGAGSVYLFLWDPAASKMIVTDWTGTELANGTDVSDVQDWPFRAVLSAAATSRREVRLRGAGRILAVEFEVAQGVTASNTDYWTVTAYLRRADAVEAQAIGETLGSLSTQRLTLVAQSPQSIPTANRPYVEGESDRLAVVVAATGNPPPLMDAVAWARVARSVT